VSWHDLADWWISETNSDPAYASEVIPLVRELVPEAGIFLDAGCGDGQVSRDLASRKRVMVGCDMTQKLCTKAAVTMSVVRACLPDLKWVREGSLDGVVCTLVIEHLDNLDQVFAAAWESVRPGGVLVIVANHPTVTAPGSANIVDLDDGEVAWRPGDYLVAGETQEQADDMTVTFYHRPISFILNEASRSGWTLDLMHERGLLSDMPDSGVPRLLGLRWRKPSE
jgi:SAM-dependent methyltransferase